MTIITHNHTVILATPSCELPRAHVWTSKNGLVHELPSEYVLYGSKEERENVSESCSLESAEKTESVIPNPF